MRGGGKVNQLLRSSSATLTKALKKKPISSSAQAADREPPKGAATALKDLLLPVPARKKAPSSDSGGSRGLEGGKVGGLTSKKRTLITQSDRTASDITQAISSILAVGNDNSTGTSSSQHSGDEVAADNILSSSWFVNDSPVSSQRRKEVRKERKAKWVAKNTQSRRFDRLLRICAQKLGTESTFEVLSKLGRETGIKECNSLVSLYVDDAKLCKDEGDLLVHIHKVYSLFKFMSEQGLQIEEETYHPLFMYLIDLKMTEELQLFLDIVRSGNSKSNSRIGYYEMLLYIKVGDKAKIQDLCSHIEVSDGEDGYSLAENYLLAFCDSDSKAELLQFLDVLDIKTVSSLEHVANIFKSLGRLSLKNFAEDFILSLKTTEVPEEAISSVICDYVTCMPNLAVEEVVSKFNFFHKKFEVSPSTSAYDKLVSFCCRSSEVHVSVLVVDQMHHVGLIPSNDTFQLILCAIEHNGEFDLILPIYSMMRQTNLVPKDNTIKSLINSFTRMRDFEGAHNLFRDLMDMNKKPTTSMYNHLLAGYFRENDWHGALRVLKQMKDVAVERDAETFSYLIANCLCGEDIEKYHAEMKQSGVKATRPVFMALINAYANVGKFDKAKQVVNDQDVPVRVLNEIKSALITALATNGKVSDAREIYNEMKQAGCTPQQKAICNLIECIRSEGELETLLKLLGDLSDLRFWFDATGRVIQYCIRHDLLKSAADLLRQLKEKDEKGVYPVLDQAFSQLWEREPTNLETGLQLLQIVKELHLYPSRTSLDFLLSSCVKARDLLSARMIWSEYSTNDLPFNVLTFLRMYQALLSSRNLKEAKKLLKQIPKEDPHVRLVINACNTTYGLSQNNK